MEGFGLQLMKSSVTFCASQVQDHQGSPCFTSNIQSPATLLGIPIKLLANPNQNEKERWFEWLWTLVGSWCQTGWSEYFQNLMICWDFPRKHLQWSLKDKIITRAAFLWEKSSHWYQIQRSMLGLFWAGRKVTVTQIASCYNKGTSLNTQHV